MTFFLIVYLYHMTYRIIFRNSTKFIYVSAIKRTTSKGVYFFIHRSYFFNLIVDDIVSLAFISDGLIVADAYGYVILYLQEHRYTCYWSK